MLYFLFILLLLAVIFAVVWLVTRGEKAATEVPDKLADPDEADASEADASESVRRP